MTLHNMFFTTEFLLKSSPEYVADWLRARSENCFAGKKTNWGSVDEERLLERGDALITLALARWGLSGDVVQQIFLGSESGSDKKTATLMNWATSFPYDYFKNWDRDQGAGQIKAFLSLATRNEISAIFTNPHTAQEFIQDWVERGVRSEHVTESKRLDGIRAFSGAGRGSGNPLIFDAVVAEKHDFEFSITSLRDSLWGLSATCPTTEAWANVVSCLYQSLTDSYSGLVFGGISVVKDLDAEFLERWRDENLDGTAFSNKVGHLSNRQEIRHFLAVSAIRSGQLDVTDALRHDDIAVRLAAARDWRLDTDAVAEFIKDAPSLAFPILIENPRMWRSLEMRENLGLAKDAFCEALSDHVLSGSASRRYYDVEAEYQVSHPEWFSQGDDWLNDDDKATDDPSERTIDAIGYRLTLIEKELATTRQRLGYVLGIGLVVLIAVGLN